MKITISRWATLAIAFSSLVVPTSDSFSDTLPRGNNVTVGEHSNVASCSIGASELSEPITTTEKLVWFMNRYIDACHDDLSAIDSAYEAEERDPQWATPVEKKIEEAAAGVEGLTVTGECRRSLCRIDLKSSGPATVLTLSLAFHQRLPPLVRGTRYAVGGIDAPTSTGIREYLFSEMLPAPFIEKFREKIGN